MIVHIVKYPDAGDTTVLGYIHLPVSDDNHTRLWVAAHFPMAAGLRSLAANRWAIGRQPAPVPATLYGRPATLRIFNNPSGVVRCLGDAKSQPPEGP